MLEPKRTLGVVLKLKLNNSLIKSIKAYTLLLIK